MRHIYILVVIALFFCAGCYRMPTDDDVSLIPNTNNPSISRPSGNQMLMPQLNAP